MSTREEILNAAEKIFVERGFSGTSMSSISDEAGVSKGLLYHHFDSKRDLWDEVVKRRVTEAGLPERIKETVSLLTSEGVDSVRTSRKYSTYFDFLRDNHQFVRMLAWLNAEGSFPMDPPDEMKNEVLKNLRKLQENGVFRDDIDPRMFVVFFTAICEHWFVSRKRVEAWFGEDMLDEEMDAKYIEAAGKLMLDGMAGGR